MTSTAASPADSLFGWPLRFMLPGGFAPASFAPNPGWTFGNVVINSTNSTAPAVEQAIVSQHSYGRQIGRLVDAVEAIVGKLPAVRSAPGVQDFLALAGEIREIKAADSANRLQRLRAELQELRQQDPEEWRRLMTER